MPKVKFHPGKVVVCCGDQDCVEIETSNDSSSGGGSAAPPWEPPTSGGVAHFAPRSMIETLDMTKIAPHDLSKHVEAIEKRFKSGPAKDDFELTVKIIVPRGSRLHAPTLQTLGRRLNAGIEIQFAPKE